MGPAAEGPAARYLALVVVPAFRIFCMLVREDGFQVHLQPAPLPSMQVSHAGADDFIVHYNSGSNNDVVWVERFPEGRCVVRLGPASFPIYPVPVLAALIQRDFDGLFPGGSMNSP